MSQQYSAIISEDCCIDGINFKKGDIITMKDFQEIASNTQLYHAIIGEYIVLKKGDPIFSETATEIKLQDDGAGPFVRVKQCSDKGEKEISITSEEWPAIRSAIEKMLEICDQF